MIAGLEARARAIGETARRRSIAKLAARLREARPDARMDQSSEGVALIGRGLLRDPRLLWIGSLFK